MKYIVGPRWSTSSWDVFATVNKYLSDDLQEGNCQEKAGINYMYSFILCFQYTIVYKYTNLNVIQKYNYYIKILMI